MDGGSGDAELGGDLVYGVSAPAVFVEFVRTSAGPTGLVWAELGFRPPVRSSTRSTPRSWTNLEFPAANGYEFVLVTDNATTLTPELQALVTGATSNT